jgi:hypothetical protein
MICRRCRKETSIATMSKFNTDEICMDCWEKEIKHPMYKRACDAEEAAVRQGNYNFRGIGRPSDL